MINTFLESIVDGLKADSEFSGYNIHFDYPSETRPNPVKKVHICIGTEKISISPCSVDGNASLNLSDFKLYGKITVTVKILVPHYMGGKECDNVMSKLISYFYKNEFSGSPEKIDGFKVKSDSYSDCFIKELNVYFNCLI